MFSVAYHVMLGLWLIVSRMSYTSGEPPHLPDGEIRAAAVGGWELTESATERPWYPSGVQDGDHGACLSNFVVGIVQARNSCLCLAALVL